MVQLQLGQVEWFRSTDGADEMNPWHNYSWGRWNESMADLQLGHRRNESIADLKLGKSNQSIADLQLGQVEWFRSTLESGGMDPWHNYSWGRWNGSMVNLQLGQLE